MITIVPDPLHSPDWPVIKALLEPAAKLGGVPVLEEHEVVWAVYPGPIAAATARLTVDNNGEIILCGGVGAKEWARDLAGMICAWFSEEGMVKAHIFGRKGWAKYLPDWSMKPGDGVTCFEKVL